MFKLKLESYDKHEAIYKVVGSSLRVYGSASAGEYYFFFPTIDVMKAINNKIDYSYIMDKYTIPTYGENIHTFFKSSGIKEELEGELNKLMKDDLNRKILIMNILEEIVIIDKDK